VRELFSSDAEIALLYFAGHGYIEDTGGFLCASDCRTGDDGFSLAELMTLASNSHARNKIIILDSCHSGIAGDKPTTPGVTEIKEGMTVLTASTAEQYAVEVPGGGPAFSRPYLWMPLAARLPIWLAMSRQAACTPISISRSGRGRNARYSRRM